MNSEPLEIKSKKLEKKIEAFEEMFKPNDGRSLRLMDRLNSDGFWERLSHTFTPLKKLVDIELKVNLNGFITC
jgi:hypothetical protein